MSKSYAYLYRARVIAYPEGSHKPHRFLGNALSRHIDRFPSVFRRKGGAA